MTEACSPSVPCGIGDHPELLFGGKSPIHEFCEPCDDEMVSATADQPEVEHYDTGSEPVFAGERTLYRHRSGRIIGGVSGGIAEHLGVKVRWVRVAFTFLVALSGAGIAAYALLWPKSQRGPTIAQSLRNRDNSHWH